MKKYILSILILLIAFVSNAQTYQNYNQYGGRWKRSITDTLQGLPADTIRPRASEDDVPFIAVKNDTVYVWSIDQLRWLPLSVAGGGTLGSARTELISGGIVIPLGGYDFFVTAALYRIDNILYTSDTVTLTLPAADNDSSRIDRFYLNIDGEATFKTGDLAPPASVLEPQLDGDQLGLAFVAVNAGASEPAIITLIIYDENTGESVVTNQGTTTDPDNTTNVQNGTKSLNVTNINDPTGGGFDAVFIDRTSPLTWQVLGFDGVTGWIKLKQVLATNADFRIQLFRGTQAVSSEVIISLNKNDITNYQPFTIPGPAFGNITNTEITRVRIRYTRPGNSATHSGFYLDNFYFIDGVVQPPPAIVSMTLNVPASMTVSPSNTIQSGGTWNLTFNGNSNQYISGNGVATTFPTIPNKVGLVQGRAPNANRAMTIDADSIFLDSASLTNYGVMSPYAYDKLFNYVVQQYYISNIGDGDTLAIPINDTVTAIKSLKEGTNVTFDITDSTITINAAGGGASSAEVVFITGDYTVADGVTHVTANAVGSPVNRTITLPSAASWPGRVITLTTASQTTFTTSPAFVYNNAASTGTVIAAGSSVDLISDGTNWRKVTRGFAIELTSYAGSGEELFDFNNVTTTLDGSKFGIPLRRLVAGSGVSITVNGSSNLEIAATGGGLDAEDAQDAVGAMINASLQYVDGTPLLAINDRDFGDLTTSGSGLTMTIDNLAVTNAKINDVAWSKVTGTPTTLSGYGITDALSNSTTSTQDGYFGTIKLRDVTNPSHYLTVRNNEDLTAAHTLNIITGDADRTLTLTGNATISGTSSGTNTGDQTTVTGNAGTATALQTPRNIQGVAFDGTANIDPINGTGFVKVTGTTLSYDNSTYLTTASAASTYQPLDADLTTISGLTATTDNFLVSVASAWASRTPAQVKTTLSLNNVENTALSTWAGTSNITTLGTIGTGTWNATAIGTNKGGTPTGGTTGQVLTKISGTDYDYSWQDAAGGGGGITQEQSEDYTGAMFATDNGDIDFTYNDATPDIGAQIKAGVIVNADINASAAIDATKIHDGSISNTEFSYLNNVSSNIQTQLDGKQKSIAYKRVFFVQAGATNVVTDGTNGVTTSGSISGITPTTASIRQSQRNIQFATGASAGTTTRCNNTSIEMTRGDAAGIGGFFCVWRFSNYALVDGNRAFFGLIDGTTALTNVDHRTNTAIARIGMYIDDDTGNWNIIHNTSGSAATSVDLGANFPINTTDLYELTLSCEPNSSTVSYYVSNLTTGNTTSGTLSSNLPAGSSFLAMHSWMNNNATAANCGFWLSKMYAEF